MVEAFSDHAESQGLDTGDGLASVRPIGHHAGQGWNLGKPTAIGFGLDFNRECHQSNVAFALAV